MSNQASTDNNNSLLDGLNEDQLKAVITPGNTLVLAGAGSGKTKVLSTRIAHMLEKSIATESSILAVTFTNKAAKEMRNRIANLRGGPVRDLWVGTFHGICNQMLREFGRKVDIDPNFHILDETDQKSMIKRILKEMNVTNDQLKATGETIGGLISQINRIKDEGGNYNQDRSLLSEVYVRYIAVCKKEGALDFADLMLRTNAALYNNTGGIRDHYRKRFSHILVDEFQDTNKEQFAWLSYIKDPSAEVFAVGDDDQSIYSFRGADPAAMNRFLREVAGNNVIKLQRNYRSTANILAAANGVIANNTGRIGKELKTMDNDGERVNVLEFDADNMESGFIAKEIKNLILAGEKAQEVAVLYRSNHQSASLERAMLNHGVPYTIYGGTRFFDRQEVKDVVAYLRLTIKPGDNTAFDRIINHPPRGLGPRTTDPVLERAMQTDSSALDITRQISANGQSKFLPFVDLMDELVEAADMLNLTEFVEYTIERTGIQEYYKNGEDGESRLKNIEELINLAARHCQETKDERVAKDAMADFLSTFTLEDSKEDNKQSNKKAITMMTIHAAKGLEFDHVFINGVEEDQLPHKNSLENGDFGVEEERRLFYVAITRARKTLYICHSKERFVYGNIEPRVTSRFVEELPEFAIHHRRLGRPPAKLGDYSKKVGPRP